MCIRDSLTIKATAFVQTEHDVFRRGKDVHELVVLMDHADLCLLYTSMAPTQKHAYRLAGAFSKNAEAIYRSIMDQLLVTSDEEGT